MNSQMSMKLCAVFGVLIVGAFADVSHLAPKQNALLVTDICLGCICEASSGCDRSIKCDGSTCGLFRMTWAYWSDGGKNTLNNEAKDSPTAYENCASDPYCAATSIQGYMAKYQQDCNEDGLIDCYDFVAIHKFGGYGCKSPLPDLYAKRFNECINTALAAQG